MAFRQPRRGTTADHLQETCAPVDRRAATQAEISDEIAAISQGVRAPPASRRPSRGWTTRRTAAACCGTPPRTCTTPTRRRSSCGRRASATGTCDPLEADLTIQHGGEPIGERMVVTGRVLDGDGRPVRRPAGRDLAGQRRRPLHPQARPAPGAARPELHRRRPLPDRRRRRLPVHHDQAGALPVEEPPQRLAAGAHPLLAVRHRVHPADDHPDVLPGRPAVRARPDLPGDRRPGARDRLVAAYDHDVTQHEWSTGYRWDIVLTGSHRTPMDEEDAA